MRQQWIRWWIIVGCMLPFDAHAINVCTCREHSLTQEISEADLIFIGTVRTIKRELNPDKTKVYFNVHAAWRNVKTEKIMVLTQGSDIFALAREGITCGYTFEKNKTYLVYAYHNHLSKHPTYAWVDNCGYTKRIEEAAEDIAMLGSPLYRFALPQVNTPSEPQDFSPTPLPETTPLPMIPLEPITPFPYEASHGME